MRELQSDHTKTRHMVITNQVQPYLLTNKLSLVEKQTLFRLRCRQVQCKSNFKSSHKEDMKCIFCMKEDSIDSEIHYLECEIILDKKDLQPEIRIVQYGDIFGDIDCQVRFVKVWRKIEEHRSKLVK